MRKTPWIRKPAIPPIKPERIVRTAAAIFVAYGFAVVVNAAFWQSLAGWQDFGVFVRALARCAGMMVIADGLIRRARWAWWVGVGLPILLLITALATFSIVVILQSAGSLEFSVQLLVSASLSIVALTTAVSLLLRRDVRASFRVAPGPIRIRRFPRVQPPSAPRGRSGTPPTVRRHR